MGKRALVRTRQHSRQDEGSSLRRSDRKSSTKRSSYFINDDEEDSPRRSSSSKKRKTKDRKKEFVEQEEDELYKVEKIIATKLDRGVTKYQVRWKGYGPNDDTWEPLENVASTGHVDRYLRKVRAKRLSADTPGVATIEYEDGEREVVDLKREKFKKSIDDSSDEEDDSDDDGEEFDDSLNNFSIVREGGQIALLWPHANFFFDAKIVSWCPLDGGVKGETGSKNAQEKGRKKQSNNEGELEEISKKKSEKNDKMKGRVRSSSKKDQEKGRRSRADESESSDDEDDLQEISKKSSQKSERKEGSKPSLNGGDVGWSSSKKQYQGKTKGALKRENRVDKNESSDDDELGEISKTASGKSEKKKGPKLSSNDSHSSSGSSKNGASVSSRNKELSLKRQRFDESDEELDDITQYSQSKKSSKQSSNHVDSRSESSVISTSSEKKRHSFVRRHSLVRTRTENNSDEKMSAKAKLQVEEAKKPGLPRSSSSASLSSTSSERKKKRHSLIRRLDDSDDEPDQTFKSLSTKRIERVDHPPTNGLQRLCSSASVTSISSESIKKKCSLNNKNPPLRRFNESDKVGGKSTKGSSKSNADTNRSSNTSKGLPRSGSSASLTSISSELKKKKRPLIPRFDESDEDQEKETTKTSIVTSVGEKNSGNRSPRSDNPKRLPSEKIDNSYVQNKPGSTFEAQEQKQKFGSSSNGSTGSESPPPIISTSLAVQAVGEATAEGQATPRIRNSSFVSKLPSVKDDQLLSLPRNTSGSPINLKPISLPAQKDVHSHEHLFGETEGVKSAQQQVLQEHFSEFLGTDKSMPYSRSLTDSTPITKNGSGKTASGKEGKKKANKGGDLTETDVSSDLTDDFVHPLNRPVKQTGHGVPLFEPEEEFGSSEEEEEESGDDEEEEENEAGICDGQLSESHMGFEEFWRRKIEETRREMMEDSIVVDIHSI